MKPQKTLTYLINYLLECSDSFLKACYKLTHKKLVLAYFFIFLYKALSLALASTILFALLLVELVSRYYITFNKHFFTPIDAELLSSR